MLLIYFVAFFIFYCFLRFTCGISKSATCLVNKTAIVTGANSGLGYQIALNLASRGCRVILADVADMEKSKTNIIQFTGNSNIVTKKLDLSSFKSVRDFASDIRKTEKKLHLLFNNAGILVPGNGKTEDSLDPLMQINYFGHFLLTHLLIGLLEHSTPSRIIFTSSLMAFINDLTVENLVDNGKRFNISQKLYNYGNSKLATIVASDILARKLKGTGVISNSVHPGFVATSILSQLVPSNQNVFLEFATKLVTMFLAKDPWEGSQSMIHAGVSNYVGLWRNGVFFVDCYPFFKPGKAYDKKFCREIWEASEKCVGLTPNEKLKICFAKENI